MNKRIHNFGSLQLLKLMHNVNDHLNFVTINKCRILNANCQQINRRLLNTCIKMEY